MSADDRQSESAAKGVLHDPDDKGPTIRFAGRWLPAHAVWHKLETATTVLEAIQRFNDRFPGLATASTREVVPLVRRRLREIELRLPARPQAVDPGAVAAALLARTTPEEALRLLSAEHGLPLDMRQLIQLAGEEAYCGALRREARQLRDNRVSSDQAMQLWNGAGRPAPGGGLWTARKIDALLAAPG